MSERAIQESPEVFAKRNTKWNLTVLLTESSMFMFGATVFDSSTVMPTLLRDLGGSDLLVGIARWIQSLGFAIPAVLAAHYIHGRSKHKPYMLANAAIGRFLVQFLWPILLLFGHSNRSIALTAIMLIYGLFWFSDGFCAISWIDMVAKAILPRYRAFFFGFMPTVNGIISILGAYIVGRMLGDGRGVIPDSYVVLAICWAISSLLGFALLAAIREPAGIELHESEKPTFFQFLKNTRPLLKKYTRLRSIILMRWTLDGVGLASAFYALYAQEKLGVAKAMLGVYILSKCLGRIVTGPLWGYLTNRFCAVIAVRTISIAILLIPILALLATKDLSWILCAVFFFMGAYEDGLWTTCQNLLYSSVEDHDRPLAVGIVAVAMVPCAFYGLLGGAIVQFGSHQLAFAIALLFGIAGVIVAMRTPRLPSES